jgi:valyl-tRNA synthetase
MVNWDPEAKTTLSDEEVEYVEQKGKLYYINYNIEDSQDTLTIATTRPETILGDTAICINPNDERFTHLKGKKVIVPICNRVIPIIEDDYVDVEFGTGCLKVTPAHDVNDKVLGDRHQLEVIDIFNEDASLNSYGLHYQGKDRFVVREEIYKELSDLGCVIKVETHVHKVGTSERTKAVIEPRLSDQWFLKMEDLVKPALKAVLETEEIKLFPKKIENTYRHWLENIRDWNVSRQLWWGQQIPAFYYGDHKEDYVVAENMDKALIIAKEKSGNVNLSLKDLRQDTDALDTWFSSWLWPISVFDGIRNPDNKEINYYYPTNDLVTGPDIIFFWVARMIFAGYEFRNDKPFNNVYFTGIVRDHQGRKMSKQLGNSPDALKLIEDYSADAVRAGMMLLSSGAGNDLLFDETKLQQGKAFINKITNAYRLVSGWEVSDAINQPASSKIAIEWYQSKFQRAYAEMEDHFSKYRLSDSLMTLYKLIWDDFCSWLLEMVKPGYQQPIDRATYDAIILAFENNLKVLHPFMPFITEEIWHQIAPRTQKEALIISRYPSKDPINNTVLNDFEIASEVISGIRTIRKEKNISFKEPIKLFVINNIGASPSFDTVIKKMGNVEHLEYISEKMGGALTYRVKSNEYFIPMEGSVNIENEIEKLSNELTYTEGFLKSIQAKLTNERFVNNAPEKVVASEKQKEADALAKITTLKNSLSSLIK